MGRDGMKMIGKNLSHYKILENFDGPGLPSPGPFVGSGIPSRIFGRLCRIFQKFLCLNSRNFGIFCRAVEKVGFYRTLRTSPQLTLRAVQELRVNSAEGC